MRERAGAEDAVRRPVERRGDPGRVADRRDRAVEIVRRARAPAGAAAACGGSRAPPPRARRRRSRARARAAARPARRRGRRSPTRRARELVEHRGRALGVRAVVERQRDAIPRLEPAVDPVGATRARGTCAASARARTSRRLTRRARARARPPTAARRARAPARAATCNAARSAEFSSALPRDDLGDAVAAERRVVDADVAAAPAVGDRRAAADVRLEHGEAAGRVHERVRRREPLAHLLGEPDDAHALLRRRSVRQAGPRRSSLRPQRQATIATRRARARCRSRSRDRRPPSRRPRRARPCPSAGRSRAARAVAGSHGRDELGPGEAVHHLRRPSPARRPCAPLPIDSGWVTRWRSTPGAAQQCIIGEIGDRRDDRDVELALRRRPPSTSVVTG